MNTILRTPPLALLTGLVFVGPAMAQTSESRTKVSDLFPKDRVLDVQITVAPKDWNKIRKQTRKLREALDAGRRLGPMKSPYTYVTADMTIDGVAFPKVGLRKKGFIGSQSARYPSLKIKLNHTDKSGEINGSTKLTLNNNKQDLSLVSQYLTYRMFLAAGLPAPRCSFARVTVNGKNLGIYSHVESVREPMCKARFGDGLGTLYEGTVVDFFPRWEASFEHKFGPKDRGTEKIAALTKVLQQSAGPAMTKAIGQHVELDEFFRFWALESLICSWDGYSANKNNYFIYLHGDTGRFHFIPWGADCYFSNTSPIPRNPRSPKSVYTNSLITHRLYLDPACRKRYRTTLLKLLDECWKEKELLAEIDRVEEMLAPHLPNRQSRSTRMLEGIRRFVRNRRDDLTEEIEEGMPDWTKEPDPPFGIGRDRSTKLSSLEAAAARGDVRALRRLLRRGKDVNARNAEGDTLLGFAATAGRADAVRYLIKAGAKIDSQNNDGSVPLAGAAFLGHPEVVEILLQAGADTRIKNKDGADPLTVAAMAWNQGVEGFAKGVAAALNIKLDVKKTLAGRKRCAALIRESRRK